MPVPRRISEESKQKNDSKADLIGTPEKKRTKNKSDTESDQTSDGSEIDKNKTDDSNDYRKNRIQDDSCQLENRTEHIEELKLVLLGKTGNGKSATGNTILGEYTFTSLFSPNSVTSECSAKKATRCGQNILVVDTPGNFETMLTEEDIQNALRKIFYLTTPGPHAFIIVLALTSRFTKEEKESLEKVLNQFGENIYKFVFVIFTHGDALADGNISIENYIQSAPSELKQFIKNCEERIYIFNNKLKGEEQERQVALLLDGIFKNVKSNHGKCYTISMFEKADRLLRQMKEEKSKSEKAEKERKFQKFTEGMRQMFDQVIEEKDREIKEVKSLISDEMKKKQDKKKQNISMDL